LSGLSKQIKTPVSCYNLRCDSLTTHCVSRCVIGARLGDVEHVRRQEEKVCGDQTSVGSWFNSFHFQARAWISSTSCSWS